jgi:uncharacterized membrane protein
VAHSNKKTEKIILTGLMTAMVAAATIAIVIPLPFTNGYIHLGDCMVFLSILILGWKYGAAAAGTGSAMADLALGFAHWAPWTLLIKGGMALVAGLILTKTAGNKRRLVIACAGIIAAWLLFNLAVRGIVRYEAAHNAAALISAAEVAENSSLMEFLAVIQTQLMTAALLIPLFLIALSVFIKKTKMNLISAEQVVAMAGGGLWMVFGYYIAGGLIYGNFAVSAFSVPANILQFVAGFALASLAASALYKTPAKKFFAGSLSVPREDNK